MNIFLESNRWKHFTWGILTGLLTIMFTLGIATGLEVKDYMYEKNFDWIDWSFTVLGGVIGQCIVLIILLI